ncbi:hypothetical protein ACMXYX_17660 (plasmid) [Neptuniibacter sp. QD72_48]
MNNYQKNHVPVSSGGAKANVFTQFVLPAIGIGGVCLAFELIKYFG